MKSYNKLLVNTTVDYLPMKEFMKEPLIFSKGDRGFIWDVNNVRYFDAIGGVFVSMLGHNYQPLNQIIAKQLEKLTFFPGLNGISEESLQFVEDFSSITPNGLNFIKSYTIGSEAIEAALKFARQYHKQTNNSTKFKTLSLNLSYHGGTLAAASASGRGERKKKFEPLVGGFCKVPSPYQIYKNLQKIRPNDPNLWNEANILAIDIAEDTIINESPDTISSFLIEPISNTAGIVEPTADYFLKLRKICDENNILLIFDEILTGMGKTGKFFATEYLQVIPDILVSGKALSNGTVPVSAIAIKNQLFESFYSDDPSNAFAHGHTFASMPLGAAVGSAVIKEIKQNNYLQIAQKNGNYLKEKLLSLKKYEFVIDVRGRGNLLCVEVDNNYFTKKYKNFTSFGNLFKQETLKNGLILRIDPHWFSMSPPLVCTLAEIDELFHIIDKSIENIINSLK
jgi:adenosylmethionine-8-amino-7-oxononanoate aminotransferase